MAIDRIPGVGPQNSDIAAAVAAPSAATIAAAVAAPSAATIAAAVAAPSAATIATQVAASVPTLSQINTAVSSNSASMPNWVLIGSSTTTGASITRTISSIPSTYRSLRLIAAGLFHATQTAAPLVRFNDDANSRYANYGYNFTSSNQSVQATRQADADAVRPLLTSVTTNSTFYFDMIIENYATANSQKFGSITASGYNGTYNFWTNANFVYNGGGTAISSVSLIDSSQSGGYQMNSTLSNGFYVFGAL